MAIYFSRLSSSPLLAPITETNVFIRADNSIQLNIRQPLLWEPLFENPIGSCLEIYGALRF
ncbi:hypothetical protein KSP39_PZI004143 [Platanthera zijinensis]|uniref:Uncharacterized protein n=1 Tax=Platanthera zijinensis TaxID=2320716 RepID=A0AAP0BWQ8_9ASPA